MDPLKTDCRHFRSDRPCAPHKEHGVICATDEQYYDKVEHRLLIVKLAAIGDVLRTTSLLHGIHKRWPRSHVTWITSPGATPLFQGNRLVDRVLAFDGTPPIELAVEFFDAVLNPDAAADACALAHYARSGQRIGFDLDERGVTRPLSAGAETWFEMGVRDDKKKANRLTYQEHMAAILGVEYQCEPPILELTDEELAPGRQLLARHRPPPAAW